MVTETQTNQYLTFRLGKEQYAVDVSQVREVLTLCPLTVLPRMPEFMKGIINIRDHVVPVVDLRKKFDMAEVEHTIDTSIIVMEVLTEGKSTIIGCLADAVEQVVGIPEESFQDAPNVGTKVEARFIQGIANNGGEFVIVLDMNRVFCNAELSAVRQQETQG